MKTDPFPPQEAVMQDYITSGIFKGQDDALFLHSFFSPNRVPAGLTDDEIKICLKLYHRRKVLIETAYETIKRRVAEKIKSELEQDFHALEKAREWMHQIIGERGLSLSPEEIGTFRAEIRALECHNVPLPKQLIKSPMTRDSFSKGLAILINYLDRIEEQL